MAPINNIPDRIPGADRLRQERVERTTRPADLGKSESSAPARQPDQVQISTQARELAQQSSDEIARYQAELQGLASADPARINQLRERIERGDFDQTAVIERVADSLLRLPVFDAVTGTTDATGTQPDLEAVSARVAEGVYRSNDILDVVARQVINEIG